MTPAIENAIVDAIKTATGLASGRVWWAGQNIDRPSDTSDFCTLQLLNVADVHNTGEHATEFSEETGFKFSSLSTHELALSVHYYTRAVRGADSALTKLSAAKNKLIGEVLTESMHLADLALIDARPIQNVPSIGETEFHGLAVLDLRFRVRVAVVESVTWIESALVTPAAFMTGSRFPVTFGSPVITVA